MNSLFQPVTSIDSAFVAVYPFAKSGKLSHADKEQLYVLWQGYKQTRETFEEMCLTGNTSMFELVRSTYEQKRDTLLGVLNTLAIRYAE